MTFDEVRDVLLAFPGVSEGPCYGTPGFRVRRRFLARLHQKEPALVLRMDMETRDFVTRARPEIYFFTDHYRDYPAVLIRFAEITPAELREHVEDAWRPFASKRQIEAFEEG